MVRCRTNDAYLMLIHPQGALSRHPTGEQLPEYSIPRFVGFANDGTEVIVAYLEPALVSVFEHCHDYLKLNLCLHRKHFSVRPWQLLRRKLLNQDEDPDSAVVDDGLGRYFV
jgi:hypothetical protein